MIVYDRICTFAFFCFFSQGFWLSIRFPWTCKPRTQSNLQKVHFVSWPCFMMFSDMEASKHRGWHYPIPACCLGWSCASVRMAPVTEGSASTVYHIQIIQKIMRRQGNQRQKKVKKKCEPSLLDAGRFAPSQLLVLPCTSLCCFSRLDKGCECINVYPCPIFWRNCQHEGVEQTMPFGSSHISLQFRVLHLVDFQLSNRDGRLLQMASPARGWPWSNKQSRPGKKKS